LLSAPGGALLAPRVRHLPELAGYADRLGPYVPRVHDRGRVTGEETEEHVGFLGDRPVRYWDITSMFDRARVHHAAVTMVELADEHRLEAVLVRMRDAAGALVRVGSLADLRSRTGSRWIGVGQAELVALLVDGGLALGPVADALVPVTTGDGLAHLGIATLVHETEAVAIDELTAVERLDIFRFALGDGLLVLLELVARLGELDLVPAFLDHVRFRVGGGDVVREDEHDRGQLLEHYTFLIGCCRV